MAGQAENGGDDTSENETRIVRGDEGGEWSTIRRMVNMVNDNKPATARRSGRAAALVRTPLSAPARTRWPPGSGSDGMLSGAGRGCPDHRHSLMDCQYINQPKLAGDYSEVRRAGRDPALGANKPNQ